MKSSGFGALPAPPTLKVQVARMAPVREVSGAGIRMRGYQKEGVSFVKPYVAVNVQTHEPDCLEQVPVLRSERYERGEIQLWRQCAFPLAFGAPTSDLAIEEDVLVLDTGTCVCWG